MKDVGIFEAKTKLSELCEVVHRTGESILVTRRGKPFVRSVPLEEPSDTGSAVWEARERFDSEYGPDDIPEFPTLHREPEPVYAPFDADDPR
jgi:prevent-host-death family protein